MADPSVVHFFPVDYDPFSQADLPVTAPRRYEFDRWAPEPWREQQLQRPASQNIQDRRAEPGPRRHPMAPPREDYYSPPPIPPENFLLSDAAGYKNLENIEQQYKLPFQPEAR